MKKCNKCNTEKHIEEFNYKNKKRNKRQSWCKECNKKYQKEHYKNNKDYYLYKEQNRRKELRKWYSEIKSKLKCVNCDENHIATLDFHHIDESKEYNLAYMYRSASKENTLKEIEKCIVLCSNCHRKLHWDETLAL